MSHEPWVFLAPPTLSIRLDLNFALVFYQIPESTNDASGI